MPFRNFKLKVISNKFIAPNILEMKTLPDIEDLNYKGGQYFSFKVGEKINRSYSTASSPNEKYICFVVDIAPQGPGSKFVEILKAGDEFDVMGPFGFFTLEKTGALEDENPIIFAATGTGIAPIRSMVVDLLNNKKSKRDIYLFYGQRYDNEAYFLNDLYKLAEEHINLKFIPVISRPGETWKGEKGYIHEHIKKMPVIKEARVYVCGRSETVKIISDDLVNFGYPKDKVFYEKFG